MNSRKEISKLYGKSKSYNKDTPTAKKIMTSFAIASLNYRIYIIKTHPTPKFKKGGYSGTLPKIKK